MVPDRDKTPEEWVDEFYGNPPGTTAATLARNPLYGPRMDMTALFRRAIEAAREAERENILEERNIPKKRDFPGSVTGA